MLPDAGLSESTGLGGPLNVVPQRLPRKLCKRNLVAVFSATLTTEGKLSELNPAGGSEELEQFATDVLPRCRFSAVVKNGNPVQVPVLAVLRNDDIQLFRNDSFPTAPTEPIAEQITRGELFDPKSGQMKPPKVTYAPDPQYSEPARILKFGGVGVLGLIVDGDGKVRDIWVSRKLGLGLDQKAIQAVRTWRFDPALKDGNPVPTIVNVEVTFRVQ
jgi:TonB family protein